MPLAEPRSTDVFPEPQPLLTPLPSCRAPMAAKCRSVRQYHPAERSGAGGAAEAEDDGDRSGARSPHRSRQSGHVPGGRPAQDLQRRLRRWRRSTKAAARPASAASSARAGPPTTCGRCWLRFRSDGASTKPIPSSPGTCWNRARPSARDAAEADVGEVRESMGMSLEYGGDAGDGEGQPSRWSEMSGNSAKSAGGREPEARGPQCARRNPAKPSLFR